ncbi:MAG TPA: hypothetical protein VL326_15280, partial [Kofleriaceae bacterium]|nr:hypothetical protein [Kofleriaceae bacterium]
MQYQCSACKRTFAEPGFCPYDRTQLGLAVDQRTVLSEHIKAQVGAETMIAPNPEEKPDDKH